MKPFQREDVQTIRAADYRMLIAHAPGCGKTIIVLGALDENPERLTPTLVIAPASVLGNWKKEAYKWVPGIRVHSITDGRSAIPKTAHLYVISWTLLITRYHELMELGLRLIVADEAHAAKNEEALRTQALDVLSRDVPHLLLLTGTPLENSLDDLRSL
ncbi:MAG: SNF2-related protein, partial [Verrucomicrobiota bacterium]